MCKSTTYAVITLTLDVGPSQWATLNRFRGGQGRVSARSASRIITALTETPMPSGHDAGRADVCLGDSPQRCCCGSCCTSSHSHSH